MSEQNDPLLEVDSREARLPVWAQKHLRMLRSRIKNDAQQLQIARSATPETADTVMWIDGGYSQNLVPIPSRHRVRVKLGESFARVSVEDYDDVGPSVEIQHERASMGVKAGSSNIVSVFALNNVERSDEGKERTFALSILRRLDAAGLTRQQTLNIAASKKQELVELAKTLR